MKVDSNGVALDVQVEGEGRPVVLRARLPRHEAACGRSRFPRSSTPGFQVITYDQRGYGASDKPGGGRRVLDPVPRDRRHRGARPSRHREGASRRPRLGRGGRVGDRVAGAATGSTISSRCRSATRARSANAGMAQREKSWYMLLFQFARRGRAVAHRSTTARTSASGATIPTSTRCIARVARQRLAHAGSQLLPRQRPARGARRPAARAAAGPGADDGDLELATTSR